MDDTRPESERGQACFQVRILSARRDVESRFNGIKSIKISRANIFVIPDVVRIRILTSIKKKKVARIVTADRWGGLQWSRH